MTGSASLSDDRSARMLLSRVSEPCDEPLVARVKQLGSVVVAEEVVAGRSPLSRAAGYATRLLDYDADAELVRAAASGARFLVPGDAEWPISVDDLGDRQPLGLWVRGGSLSAARPRAIAIVGSRAATAYGEQVASDLAASVGERGWAVVSGGAYGIDSAAHRGALAVGAATVAVLACGVDVAYPRGHHALFERILEQGALVSELPPGCHPTRGRFLERNRLIAALGAGTVVVEASHRSGTSNTVGHAETLARPTMAVPGPVTSPSSAGTNQLIRDGRAVLVTDADEVLEIVGPMGEVLPDEGRGPVQAHDQLDSDARRVWEALPVRRAVGVARLASTAGLDQVLVAATLGRLESLGLARLVDDGWLVVRP